MTGSELAQKVRHQYGPADVFELVQATGVTILYAHWHPTTMGEFHKKTKTIYVNLNASIEKEHIIAHELGHYFIDYFGLKMSKDKEEKTVNDFVKTLQEFSTLEGFGAYRNE
jgi:Zn-dependent peptidase ImmA (M78 family)